MHSALGTFDISGIMAELRYIRQLKLIEIGVIATECAEGVDGRGVSKHLIT